jgi:TRAP-type C4-dicarboxylate transport system permease small subunit
MSFGAGLLSLARRVQRAQLLLAAAALVMLMLVTVTDVFLRYVFNRPLRGSYEFVESMLIVFVFHGMAAAFFGRRNIVIDLIDPLVGARGTGFLIRAADVLSVLCLALLFWAMLGPALQVYAYGDLKIDLGLPIWLLWVTALAGMTGTMLCAAVVLVARPAVPERERFE